MRTLPLSLAGTVILLLLGGLGGAVIGQTDPATSADAAYVTGNLVWIHDLGRPTVTMEEGVTKVGGCEMCTRPSWTTRG